MEPYPRRDVLGQKRRKKGNFYREVYEWVESAVISVLAVVIVFTFAFRLVSVDGSSMNPTLENGDLVLITGLYYELQPGDIVVATQKDDPEHPLIKRVIATGNQVVDMDFETGTVWVDGEKLEETYIKEPATTGYDVTFPQTVPEGHVFLLGDNRNDSLDSRSSKIGMVDERYIMGKAVFRILPINKIGRVK